MGTAYRGVRNYQDLDFYKKKSVISWFQFSGLSKKKSIAEKFSNSAGMIFEIKTYTARDISSISQYTDEEEVVLMHFSYFFVDEVIQKEYEPIYVKLIEIPVPRSMKALFWVDDCPENNYDVAYNLELQNISFVPLISTQHAMLIINSFTWLLNFPDSHFRIVTDMVRKEESINNYYAGIDLMEFLFKKYKYSFMIFCFCSNIEKASENCKNRKLKGNFVVSSSQSELLEFLKFGEP